jgi:hypothetical protein
MTCVVKSTLLHVNGQFFSLFIHILHVLGLAQLYLFMKFAAFSRQCQNSRQKLQLFDIRFRKWISHKHLNIERYADFHTQ